MAVTAKGGRRAQNLALSSARGGEVLFLGGAGGAPKGGGGGGKDPTHPPTGPRRGAEKEPPAWGRFVFYCREPAFFF